MLKALLVSGGLLVAILALSFMQGGHGGLDPKDQLALEHQVSLRRAEALADLRPTPPALACAAGRLDRASVQVFTLVWVNGRADLVTPDSRTAADAALDSAITACGGNREALEQGAHAQGEAFETAAARAMLRSNRS